MRYLAAESGAVLVGPRGLRPPRLEARKHRKALEAGSGPSGGVGAVVGDEETEPDVQDYTVTAEPALGRQLKHYQRFSSSMHSQP